MGCIQRIVLVMGWGGLSGLLVAAGCAHSSSSEGGGSGSGAGNGAGAAGNGAGNGNPILDPGVEDPGPEPGPGYLPPPPDDNCGTRCFRDGSLPEDAPAAFEGAASSEGRPEVVYPLAHSMHPINIGEITFHWKRSAQHSLFRVRVSGAAEQWDFFVPCEGVPGGESTECTYTLPENSWLALAYALRGTEVAVTIAGTSGAGGPVAESPPLTLAFSPWVVQGGLYYWSTALPGTYRLVFGARKATPFIAPQTPENPSTCSGCHTVSRSGNAIAFTGGPVAATGHLVVSPTDNPGQPYFTPSDAHDSSMPALSPDGSLVAVAYDHKLVVRSALTGAMVSEVPSAMLGGHGNPYFPEWSPDGTELVVTLSPEPDAQWSVRSGKIAVLPYNGGSWGPAQVIVADELMNFYPSYSPDGRWIAFSSSPKGASLISYDQSQARLRLVSRDGGAVHELGKATQAVGKASTWPKFAPFEQADGKVLFITFNSKIDYGLLLKNSVLSERRPQLWFAAIDLRKLGSGDPSFAPVWLPFQDTAQNNHLGFWTEHVTCDVDQGSFCGVDENCVGKRCTVVR